MTVATFWYNDPYILFNKTYITQLWPTSSMSFDEKLNAITRIVILLTVLGFIVTRNYYVIIIGFLTIDVIYLLHRLRKQKYLKEHGKKMEEGFENNNAITNNSNSGKTKILKNLLQTDYYPVTKKNPMGNVLLTDIGDDPERLSAQPSFNPDVHDDINSKTKRQTQMLYPGIKSTSKQLYGDLYDNYQFDNDMMRNFYSMPNTRVTNDQGAFGEWLYGNMPSGKSSGPDGAFARVQDNARYILI